MRITSRPSARLCACAALTLLAGCAFPGSRLAKVGVTCRVVDAEGRGTAGTELAVSLPASYGLTGLDAIYGEPATYGHERQRHAGVTDSDGTFATEFQTTHTMAFFVIPPVGTLLYRQTKPLLWLRVGGSPARLYTICADGDGGLSIRERDPDDGDLLDVPSPEDVTGTSVELDGWRHFVTITRR